MPDGMPVGDTLILWRAFVPKWAHAPLSGAGAARFGGRWNPVGSPTIYAALELSTAWAEYNQSFVQHPALIVRMELSGARLARLTEPADLEAAGLPPDIHETEWRDLLERGIAPPTHVARSRLLADGYDGVVYPSFMSRGGTCVALWRWNEPGAPGLVVIDPDHRLPRSPASWL
jgi:RES domain-containing protein